MSPATPHRLAFVDSLRLLAAGLVVFQHLAERFPAMPGADWVVLGPGVAGVVLFFLISGFVIPFSVERHFHLPTFLTRRIFRIYPLFLVAILIVAIAGLTGLLKQWRYLADASPFNWIANLLLVQDFVGEKAVLGVSWTLIIEMIWYAVFAIMFMWKGSRAGMILAIFLPLGMMCLALASLALEMRIPLGRPGMIYAASLGYLAYLHHVGRLERRLLLASILLFLAVTGFTSYVAFGHFSHPDITLAQAIGPWTIATLAFFGVALSKPLREAGLLTKGWLPLAGAASYSIYLLHPIANAAAQHYVTAPWQVAVALVLTGALAFLGYQLVEKPGIALGRTLSNSLFDRKQHASMVAQ